MFFVKSMYYIYMLSETFFELYCTKSDQFKNRLVWIFYTPQWQPQSPLIHIKMIYNINKYIHIIYACIGLDLPHLSIYDWIYYLGIVLWKTTFFFQKNIQNEALTKKGNNAIIYYFWLRQCLFTKKHCRRSLLVF